MNKEFEEGIEFGCISAWLWYLLWFGLAFYAGAKTHDIMYVFGVLSAGLLAGIWLSSIVKLFLLKE